MFDMSISERRKISKYWFPQDLSFFQISRNCKYSKLCFPHFCLIYPALSDKYFLSIGFHMTCHLFRFQGIPSYVFNTFCLIYPALSDENFLSIGFHIMTFHFFRFQGIAKIPNYVFHTFCLIYPAMAEDL